MGEKVFAFIYSLFPEADIYTIVYNERSLTKLNISRHKVTASFIQRLPFAKKRLSLIYTNMIANLLFISPVCLIGILLNFIFPTNNNLYLKTIVFAQKKDGV
jgi:hypothetical protein